MHLDILKQQLITHLGDKLPITQELGELTLDIPADQWFTVCTQLRDLEDLSFETCIDLCGVDYQSWGCLDSEADRHFPKRFAVFAHLLSVKHNWRLCVRTFAQDNDFPVIKSLNPVWNGVNWFEREAFDMFGIVFDGHPDLRRILTDYGFIGHPFRKDFPLSGHVEMIYDEASKRVIYQPVSIEPREITPRIIREDGYGVGR